MLQLHFKFYFALVQLRRMANLNLRTNLKHSCFTVTNTLVFFQNMVNLKNKNHLFLQLSALCHYGGKINLEISGYELFIFIFLIL